LEEAQWVEISVGVHLRVTGGQIITKEKDCITIDQILELRIGLLEEFGEKELKKLKEEFQEIDQNPELYSLSEKDRMNIKLFLELMRIPAPSPSNC
jgi:hypothetical protein